jgi:phage baseplate assembly protein V
MEWQRKIRMLAGRAVLSLMSDAFTAQMKGLDGEVRDDAEVFQQYGFRSQPQPGAEGILLALGGNRDHTVILCLDDRRYTITLSGGECAMYDDLGKYIVLKRDGSILVKAQTKVRMEVPRLEVTGEIIDRCDSGGFSMSDMRGKHNGHDHKENNITGGNTGKPNQVF